MLLNLNITIYFVLRAWQKLLNPLVALTLNPEPPISRKMNAHKNKIYNNLVTGYFFFLNVFN